MKSLFSGRILVATLLFTAGLLLCIPSSAIAADRASRHLSSGFSSFWEWLAWFLRGGKFEATTTAPSVSPTQAPVLSSVFHPIRINCGGSDYIDTQGIEWTDDAYFNDQGKVGASFFAFFFRLKDAQVFQSYRATTSDPLIYSIPVPPGSYDVNMYFANPFSFYLPRSFNVYIQDEVRFSSDAVGAPGHIGPTWGTKLSTKVAVDDDQTIDIKLRVLKRLASISAIEILSNVDGSSVDPITKAPASKAPVSLSPSKPLATSAPTVSTSTPTPQPTEPMVTTSTPTDATTSPTVHPTEAMLMSFPTGSPFEAPISVSPTRTMQPSVVETNEPSMYPTKPTVLGIDEPTIAPNLSPTMALTESPTLKPTAFVTLAPTESPTSVPSKSPTMVPTVSPAMEQTTNEPTMSPTTVPTKTAPTSFAPTRAAVTFPTTELPTVSPTIVPTGAPTSLMPSKVPVAAPTDAPAVATSNEPSSEPTAFPKSGTPTKAPVQQASAFPTAIPSKPTVLGIDEPTIAPALSPTVAPTEPPTLKPTVSVTLAPTASPTSVPSKSPTMVPTVSPTMEQTTNEPTMSRTMVPTTTVPTTFAPTRAPVTFPTTELPTVSPTIVPTEAPISLMPSEVPAAAPTDAPAATPSNEPSSEPTAFPTSGTPTKAPVRQASAFPTAIPSATPSAEATLFPTLIPSGSPTNAPTTPTTRAPSTEAPTLPPTPTPTETPEPFETIRINAGGSENYIDVLGRTWIADTMFSGGRKNASLGREVFDTQDDILYQTSRFGVFRYDIPVPNGDYEVVLHFTELITDVAGERVFVAKAEGEDMFGNIDIFAFGGFTLNRAVTMEKAVSVSDGSLTLSLEEGSPKRGEPKLCAVEIKSLGPHLAHSVAGGPYTVVDTTNAGNTIVAVDGSGSHTHGPGLSIVEYVWRSGFDILGEGEKTSLELPVGVSPLTLTVRDSGGNVHTETTIVTVLSSEFPNISNLSQLSGPVEGGTPLTITGTGFSFSSAETTVKFGLASLTGSQIQVIDNNTIRLTTTPSSIAAPVSVSVITPVGESSEMTFTYFASDAPIDFMSGLMVRIRAPTAVAFGPDGRLYVGTYFGQLNRIEFQDGNLKVAKWVQETVTPSRAILGITFDPLDTAPISTPYIAHSFLFHLDETSSSGEAINGKISKVNGIDLNDVEDVITGLPVSDHDHAVNQIQFGDNGELYITVGGNTNAGLPGAMTSSLKQKENVLSAAVLVAYVNRPDFDGELIYDAPDDGNLVGGNGIELYSVGFRNPFGLLKHSNGNLYTNDNGPNLDFGDIMLGCNGERMADKEDLDKLILLEKGKYYGHPNPKRAESDPRQCTWHPTSDPSGDGYTAPLMTLESATGGMTEFMTNHFGGQLRGNLIYSKFGGALHRVILSGDGRSVLPISNPALPLVGDFSLAVTQSPMGELIEARYDEGHIFFHRPIETPTTETQIKGVFPYRGGKSGGSTLNVYGVNMNKNGQSPTIRVGGSTCPVTVVKAFRVACTLPSGSGTVDVELQFGFQTFTFPKAYRYISGR